MRPFGHHQSTAPLTLLLLVAVAVIMTCCPCHAARLLKGTAATNLPCWPGMPGCWPRPWPRPWPQPQPPPVPGQIVPGVASGLEGNTLANPYGGTRCWDPATNTMLPHGSARKCVDGGDRFCDDGNWRIIGNCRIVPNPYINGGGGAAYAAPGGAVFAPPGGASYGAAAAMQPPTFGAAGSGAAAQSGGGRSGK